MPSQEFNFNFLNTKFFGQYFKVENTKAVVLLVHGLGEHSDRYTEFVIPKFLENNISVVTYDQFGHGKTEGKRGHNPSFKALLDCITILTTKTKELFGSVPLFLYGHSMGGNVVLNYILQREHEFVGAIATSPFLRVTIKPPSWKLTVGKILQKIAPSMTVPNEINPQFISRDAKEVEKYKNDPLVHNKVSPNYSLAFFDSGIYAINQAHTLKTPTLVLHGTADQITDPNASKEFVTNSNGIATLLLFDDAYHELHNDLEREKFMNSIIDWIHKKST